MVVVPFASHVKVLLQASQSRIACNELARLSIVTTIVVFSLTDVDTVNEAEKVEEKHGRDSEQIQLPPQAGLSFRVEGHQRVSVTRFDSQPSSLP